MIAARRVARRFVAMVNETPKGETRQSALAATARPVMFSDERDEPLGPCSERALTLRCDLPLLRPLRDDRLERHDFRPVRNRLRRVEVKPLEEVVENRWGLAQQLITTERIEMRGFG